ncbi:MAG: 50S ribosomal protein L24 [Candidatus Diapherotrites archaeon]|nr:50S ribosomal protein L24 [Candidatus Diapherotrites archaeon]
MESSKPKKNRKAFYERPLHQRQKEVASHLSKKLAEELGRRSLSVRKGDEVKIVRGDFKGKSGKISKVDVSRLRVFIEKIVKKKADGTEAQVPIQPSKLVIESLDRGDSKRLKFLDKAKVKPEKVKAVGKAGEKGKKGEK